MKKHGRHLQGAAPSRNGAGTARQEYRTLWGITLVWAILPIPFQRWPGHSLSLPMGLALSRKVPLATTLKVPSRSRSTLARRIIDPGAADLPARAIRVASDGGYATQTFWRDLPPHVEVVGRFCLTGTLYQPPPPRVKGPRGAPRQKGNVIGAPKTWATPSPAGPPHPQEAGACIQSWVGLWHSVFPGRLLRVVVGWRAPLDGPATPHRRKAWGRLKPLEAFCRPHGSLSAHPMVEPYAERWAMAIDLRDGHAYDGRAPDQGRQFEPMVGAKTWRFLLAAARPLWCIVTSAPQAAMALQRLRPWSRHKGAPSQFDVAWACRDVLPAAGICPLPRVCTAVAEHQQEVDKPKALAA